MVKLCKKCRNEFPSTTEYFYKHPTTKDGLGSSCKTCTREASIKWRENNPEKYKETYKSYDNRGDVKEKKKEHSKKWLKDGKLREWQRNNKDKVKEYQEKRKYHKTHDISDEELKMIYEYTNYSCMYCGETESDAIKKYGQKLHKDHAHNNGSDEIDNCILACKSCNSSKREVDWDVWFKTKHFYSNEREQLIRNWLQLWK